MLRAVLVRALTDQPEAIIVDLSELEVADDSALLAFPVAARRAQVWPATALILAAPRAAVARAMDRTGIARRVPVVGSVEQAVADRQAAMVQPGRLHQWYKPVPAAAILARELADRACRLWGVTELSDVAQLLITELVSNAVRHARSELRASLALRAHRLLLSVQDRSTRPVRLGGADDTYATHGRGLIVVKALAARWGCLVGDDGKAVWAVLGPPGADTSVG